MNVGFEVGLYTQTTVQSSKMVTDTATATAAVEVHVLVRRGGTMPFFRPQRHLGSVLIRWTGQQPLYRQTAMGDKPSAPVRVKLKGRKWQQVTG